MKPCRQFKERIALSIAEAQTDAAIEKHLLRCPACRAYAEEMRVVCAEHTDRAFRLPSHDAPVRLRGKIRAALDGTGRRWGWIRPVAAGALAAVIVGWYLHWRSSPEPVPVVAAPVPQAELPDPSYALYRNHLSRSAEELEAALSRHDTAAPSDELFAISSRAT